MGDPRPILFKDFFKPVYVGGHFVDVFVEGESRSIYLHIQEVFHKELGNPYFHEDERPSDYAETHELLEALDNLLHSELVLNKAHRSAKGGNIGFLYAKVTDKDHP